MRKQFYSESSHRRGFTLIELAIVLVIIGLIVGGVLVGADMIKSAELRATVLQVEKINTAINTFRARYNALPGDMTWQEAVASGLENLCAGSEPNCEGMGDADRRLEGASGTVDNATTGDGEVGGIWRHLSQANMVDGNFDYDDSATATVLGRHAPTTKLDRGAGFGVYFAEGQNFLHIGLTGAANPTDYTFTNILSPADAFAIDAKRDDGQPDRGQVIARGGAVANGDASNDDCTADGDCPTNPVCVNTNAGSTGVASYNNSNPDLLCQLRLRLM